MHCVTSFKLRCNANGFQSNIICLDSKEKTKFFKYYRLISLYNVVYKIFTKVLANRLKVILPKVNFETQCAFLCRWMIMDKVDFLFFIG